MKDFISERAGRMRKAATEIFLVICGTMISLGKNGVKREISATQLSQEREQLVLPQQEKMILTKIFPVSRQKPVVFSLLDTVITMSLRQKKLITKIVGNICLNITAATRRHIIDGDVKPHGFKIPVYYIKPFILTANRFVSVLMQENKKLKKTQRIDKKNFENNFETHIFVLI